jgi:gamma-glutamyltranspeptidase
VLRATRARLWCLARKESEGERIFLEEGLWEAVPAFEREGYTVVRDEDTLSFGGGQAIMRTEAGLMGGSDPRKDGWAAGF